MWDVSWSRIAPHRSRSRATARTETRGFWLCYYQLLLLPFRSRWEYQFQGDDRVPPRRWFRQCPAQWFRCARECPGPSWPWPGTCPSRDVTSTDLKRFGKDSPCVERTAWHIHRPWPGTALHYLEFGGPTQCHPEVKSERPFPKRRRFAFCSHLGSEPVSGRLPAWLPNRWIANRWSWTSLEANATNQSNCCCCRSAQCPDLIRRE
mmetsp:Transcript_16895/g.42221  ORF Transcript_16895/g.42221 Transcript_16895/m.42221 type:complete len:206 (-) Transcript_16895:504-1121(-)